MFRRLWLPLALVVALAGGCATYTCQTEFGQDPPLVNKAGKKYWPTRCVAGSVYTP